MTVPPEVSNYIKLAPAFCFLTLDDVSQMSVYGPELWYFDCAFLLENDKGKQNGQVHGIATNALFW